MERDQATDLIPERILETPRMGYIFAGGRIPPIFLIFQKSGLVCLTNKRLGIIEKIKSKSSFGFRLSTYKVEDLEKDFQDPRNIAIPLADIVKVDTGRAPLLFGPYLKVQHGFGTHAVVGKAWPKSFDSWRNTINSAKVRT